MSFFYLCPVRGDMPIHLLETIVYKRIKFLSAIIKGEPVVFDEFVIEGSVYDNVGHFMICTITILSDKGTLSKFFLQSEYELFKRRLASLSAYDLRSFAKKLLRSIKKFDSIPSFIEPLEVLCQHLLLKNVAQHISLGSHEHSCSVYNINVNFKHCLPFLSTRQVEIQNGTATVPCGKFKQYLIQLFHKNLEYQVADTHMEVLRNDPRIMELVQKVTKEHFPLTPNQGKNILLSQDVDKSSNMFPPCMLNLLRNLRTKHRLSHDQRFKFSLFLKDIGMPVDEAIQFWRMEYRQASAGSHCSHHWEKDEKKYLYGIRHMYGLEGARKSYTSVSCQRIQSNTNAGSEGGCPFKTFDQSNMVKLLDKKCAQSQSIMSQINDLQRRRQYSMACMLYHQERFTKDLKDTCDKLSFNFTPVYYYKIAFKTNKP